MIAVNAQPGEREVLLAKDPLLMKFAHFLAGRPDLLREEHLGIVALPDRAPHPLPPDEVRTLLVAAWGERGRRRIASVSMLPHAARILDQCHAIRLADGEEGEVRVWRPDAAELFASVASRRDALLAMANQSCDTEPSRLPTLVDGFEPWLAGQMPRPGDLGHVRVSAGPLRTTLADLPHVTSRIAEGAVQLVFRDAFERHRIHDAPHAANLGVGPRRDFEWLSTGAATPLTVLARRHVRDLWYGLLANDEERVVTSLRGALECETAPAWTTLEADVRALMRRAIATSPSLEGSQTAEVDGFDSLLLAMLRAVGRSELELPEGEAAAHRMLLGTCLALRRLPGSADPQRSMRRELARAELRAAIESIEPESIPRMASGLVRLAQEGPERLGQILEDLADGRLGVTLTFDETPEVAASWVLRIRLMATAVASLGPWFVLARLLEGRALTSEPVLATAAVLALLHLWMVKQWRNMK